MYGCVGTHTLHVYVREISFFPVFLQSFFQERQLFLGFYKLMEQACQIVFMREETGRWLGLQTEGYWAITFFIELL